MRKLGLISTAIAILALPTIALAGGFWSQLPIVGVPDSTACQSFGNNNVCNQYNPAGPSEASGSYTIPADTGALSGANPQTVSVPLSLMGQINVTTNRLIGGDFGTNLWQRGTTPVSAATPSTTVIGADRWAVYSSGNTVTVSKQIAAADSIPSIGLYASQRVNRPSGTNNTAICVGQVLDKQAAAPLIGNNAVFSFWALAGAALTTVASNQITATIAYYTAADSATPLTNTDTFMKGTVTGYTAVTTQGGPVSSTTTSSNTATISAGVATQAISTTWTRYSFWGKIPTANASGTAVTGVGVTICYTPASGTGGSTEWFEFTGAQLQATSSVVTTQLPFGVTAPTSFERRHPQIEAELQQYYSYSIPETNGTIIASGACSATNVDSIPITFPATLRIAPTAATSTFTAGGFQVIINGAAGAGVSGTTLVAPTANFASLKFTNACTAGQTVLLTGTGTTGLLLFSAEP